MKYFRSDNSGLRKAFKPACLGLVLTGFALASLVTGCGSKELEKPPATPKPVATQMPQLSQTAEPAPAQPVPAAPALNAAAVPAVAAPGQATDANSDALRVLNLALRYYEDPASRPNAGDTTPEAQRQYPPIKDLSDLIKAGFLKALPPAPAGKQFAIDPHSHQVVLADKK